ncbi:MAG: SAM-dependent chlorinase/fluorinase [Archaeoglobus sp.]|nr:SAM-dependent chlorinase/fluorinase [Archaeoglobus sp.]
MTDRADKSNRKFNLITLLTDFGDLYLGIMKGVILSINPAARIIDISHSVEPQNVKQAAFLLASYHSFFENCVHVAVIDPGVGGEREIILAENDSNCFIAPNNGVLSEVIDGCRVYQVNTKKASKYTGKLSSTFHGRDVFAPAAALVTMNRKDEILEPFKGEIIKLNIFDAKIEENKIDFSILYIDNFGNAVTNIKKELIDEIQPKEFILNSISFPFVEKYVDVGKGEALTLVGSFETLEFSIREGNAAEKFGFKTGRFKVEFR